MTAEIKPEVIKRTQEILGRHIKKPPLTDKLLKKPPFRFLHDIITSVIRGTGFLEGVLSPEEMSHENIKDKDGKIAFLQKVIDFVVAVSGTPLSVRPGKIVAGHEPTKTNEFLQAIGKALDDKKKKVSPQVVVPTQGLVKKVATKVTPVAKQASTRDTPTKSTPSVSSITKPTKSQPSKLQERTKTKEVEKRKISTKTTSDTKVRSSSQGKAKPTAPSLKKENIQQPITVASDFMGENVELMSGKEQEETDIVDETVNNASETADAAIEEVPILPATVKDVEEATPVAQELEMRRPPSAHFRQRKSSDSIVDAGNKRFIDKPSEEVIVPLLGADNSDQVGDKMPARRPMSVRPPTARPASARPAAPRIRDRGDVPVNDEANLAAGSVSVTVIADNDTSNNQDDDDFLVVQSKPVIAEDDKIQETAVPMPEGQQGHLVAQILETQKDFDNEINQEASSKPSPTRRVDIEWEGGRKRDREAVKQEVNNLRTVIQKATSVVNPFGKLMDYVQEDVDAMARELEMWRETNKQLTMQLREEQRLTDQAIEPMKLQLDQLEESIREKRDQISALKSTVIHNDNRIKQLLTGDFGTAH